MPTLAIIGGAVLTMDDERRVLRPGTVIVEDRHITAVGPAGAVDVPSGAAIIDATGHVVMPGLVNCHAHVPQLLLRSSAASQDRDLMSWLFDVLYPGLDA